jgi:hypothetical protein
VLVPLVRARAQVRVFPQGWRPDAEAFQPAALAGEWAQFEALLGRDIPSLTHAIIVLSRDTGELLNEGQRKDLWRAFRVPVFEQILAGNGSLLAAECEAHDGLHVESPDLAVKAGCVEAITLALEPCGCGKTAERLKRVGRDRERILSIAV